MREEGLWSPEPESLQFCFTESGSHRRLTCRSTQFQLVHVHSRNVATTPRSGDCARDWVVKRPTDNWQHRFSNWTSTGTEPAAHKKCV